MPKENKKRGRREEQKKRKRDVDDESSAKRHKKEDVQQFQEEQPVQNGANGEYPQQAQSFYGMLDEEEQEYFKKADEMLELDQFESAEDRSVFLGSVWREAEEKELKLANDPSASRLLERLILLSTPEQLKGLFQKFSGQYVCRCAFHISYANQSQLPRARPTQDRLALPRDPLHPSRTRRHGRVRQLQVQKAANTTFI
jgi:nucleolar protein 9